MYRRIAEGFMKEEQKYALKTEDLGVKRKRSMSVEEILVLK